MSRNNYSAAIEFKIENINLPESLLRFIYSESGYFIHCGWICPHNEWIEDIGPVYTLPFAKGNVSHPTQKQILSGDNSGLVGDHKVFLVNESSYSNVGGELWSIGARDIDSLKLFIKDFNIASEVKTNSTLQFTV